MKSDGQHWREATGETYEPHKAEIVLEKDQTFLHIVLTHGILPVWEYRTKWGSQQALWKLFCFILF